MYRTASEKIIDLTPLFRQRHLEDLRLRACTVLALWTQYLSLAVLVLYNVVGQWNSYFYAMMFLKDQDMYPLQIILRDILVMNSVSSDMTVNISEMILKQGLADVLKYALIVVSSAPLLAVYPFIQKHFVKGVMIGSVKG